MAYFGIDTQVRIEEINNNFKNIIRQRGGMGLSNLRAAFNKYDRNGNGKLDLAEFEEALSAYG
jgi:Ca2+-binding EF-hand superfamily protein